LAVTSVFIAHVKIPGTIAKTTISIIASHLLFIIFPLFHILVYPLDYESVGKLHFSEFFLKIGYD